MGYILNCVGLSDFLEQDPIVTAQYPKYAIIGSADVPNSGNKKQRAEPRRYLHGPQVFRLLSESTSDPNLVCQWQAAQWSFDLPILSEVPISALRFDGYETTKRE